MAVTYEPIASQTLGADTATVTFSAIGGSFSDLILVTDTKRTVGTTGGADILLRFNSDTASNYSATYLQGNGTTASSGRASSQTSINYVPSVETSATSTGVAAIHIMAYSNTNVFKTVLVSGGAPIEFVRRVVGLWRSTSAITSIDVLASSGSLKSGSTFSLYGIKAA